MIDKFKNIKIKVLILVLVLTLFIPATVFAGTHTPWDKYNEEVKKAIMTQQTHIKIDFNESVYVGSDNLARILIDEKYLKLKGELPRHLVELNIKSGTETTVPLINNKYLKNVIHTIEYKNSKQDFDNIRLKLDIEYQKINTKPTDYDKIKYVYDYIVAELGKEKTESIVKTILDEKNAHTVLFAMMMTDLGFNNDIAGKEGDKWNLVEVQGKWYHVNAKLEDLGSNNDTYFLIVKGEEDPNWANDIKNHNDKEFAEHKYIGETASIQQLKYEIGLINEEVNNILGEINQISIEEIQIEEIGQVKKDIQVINKKITNFVEIREVLEPQVNIINNDDLNNKFEEFIESLSSVKENIETKTTNINKIEIAIKAVEDAEQSVLTNKGLLNSDLEKETKEALGNIDATRNVYKALMDKLQKLTNIKDSKLMLDEAESKLQNYVGVDTGIEYSYKLANQAKKIIDTILDSQFNNLKKEFTSIIIDIDKVKAAKDKVLEAETEVKTKEKRDAARKAINIVNAKYDRVKVELNTRITQLEENLISEVVSVATNLVSDAKNSIVITDEDDLKDIIAAAEGLVKTAEAEVKKIKDANVKKTQQNRIKEIKLVVAAIKAVDKAETAMPGRLTDVTAAHKVIKKAIEDTNKDYELVMITLTKRLNIVESKISKADTMLTAIKAVEKAESSMKDIDIALSKEAVDLLGVLDEDGFSDIIDDLTARIKATVAVVLVENNLTRYLNKSSLENKIQLDESIDDAKEIVDQLIENIPSVPNNITKLRLSRRIVIDNVMIAINLLEDFKDDETEINDIEEAITKITDSKIRKQLEIKLKEIKSHIEIENNNKKAADAMEDAENSLKEEGTSLTANKVAVIKAEGAVKKLPSGHIRKDYESIIKELNNAIKAKETVEKTEDKMNNKTLTLKDVVAVEKAILNIKEFYKPGLDSRVKNIRTEFESNEADTFLEKAEKAIKFATDTKLAKDINAAKKAVNLVTNELKKLTLTKEIEELEISIAISAVEKAEESATEFIGIIGKTTSKDIGTAKNAAAAISSKEEDGKQIKTNLNARILVLESYTAIIKLLENAEKTMNLQNKNAVDKALENYDKVVDKVIGTIPKVYDKMKADISARILIIKQSLDSEADYVTTAENAVIAAENKMTVEGNPDYILIQTAQKAVDIITDKTIKLTWQKRIDDIQVAKDAKFAVIKATTILNDKNIKDAETVVGKINDRYFSIIENLTDEIARLKKQLNIDKLVTEAAKIVQKAVASRRSDDIISARWALRSIEELDDKNDPKNPYNTLKEILDDLDDSIKNEAGDQTAALKEAKASLKKAIEEIYGIEAVEGVEATDGVNTDIINIDQNDPEKVKIEKAYGRIQIARNHIAVANAAVGRLRDKGQQKDLSQEIDSVNKGIDLADDKIDILEAVRLVTIASSSATNAKDKQEKAKAKLDIDAARRAVDKIGHSDHKAIKSTFVNTINAVEKKLSTDNDQGLIDLAIDAVNSAADILAKAVKDNMVKENQDQIDKAIFAARIAISGISDNNKGSKDTLTGFINDIAAMFVSEKDGILNDERIKNAEKAVTDAESKKGTDELENFIRSARLKVRMIQKDGYPETELIIEGLNNRLDILEGKSGGSSGNGGSGGNKPGTGGSGSNKPGGSSGSNKPGSGGTTPGAIIPTSPISDKDRLIGTTDPIWGKTNQLNKKNPTTDIPNYNMNSIRVMESKINITELSNMLKAAPNTNAKLVVRGKNIKLDSKPYIHDKVNNSILLPIKFLGDEIGFSVSLIDNPTVKGAKRLLINGIVDGKVKSIIIDIGSEYSYVNGSLVKVSSKAVIQAGRTYIPIDFMVEHFGLTFSYYKEGNNIQLIIN